MDTTLEKHMKKYPHNTDTGDKFPELVAWTYEHYLKHNKFMGLEEFIQRCLDMYGGTIAGALVDYISNNVND